MKFEEGPLLEAFLLHLEAIVVLRRYFWVIPEPVKSDLWFEV